ncbi:MAG: hypothetical protein HY908_00610 [Myxococcales bacterium]|nr:hypothetical protein [Myxococcales bacterium]
MTEAPRAGLGRLGRLLGVLGLGLGLAGGLGACNGTVGLRPELAASAAKRDALGLLDALEALIDAQQDTTEDREAAYAAVREWEQPTAAYTFARAAITGRAAQQRGVEAEELLHELERYAIKSRELDPGFRKGAAARMLGTLYVLAPAAMLEHGDSEKGLEILEKLATKYPNDPENHLRLAQGYVSLNDKDAAHAPLCTCLGARASLRPDSQRLLAELVGEVGGEAKLTCP